MHENDERTAGALPVLRPGLECIPIRSNPGRVSVSGMYEEDQEIEKSYDQDKQQPTLFEVMEKICRIIECLTCGGMIYVLARMAGIA